MDGAITRLIDEWRARRLRRLLPEMLVVLAGVMLIWSGVALMLWQARSAAVESATGQTITLARAFAESSQRIATVLDRHLLSLRAAIAEKGETFDLLGWERTQSSPDSFVFQTGIIDRTGVLAQNTMDLDGRRINLSDREHFRAQLDPERDVLFISKPMTGRVSLQCSLQFSRKIFDRDGYFAGVAVVSLGCDQLSRFYEIAGVEGGFIMIAGADGIVRGAGPARGEFLGLDLRHTAGFEALWSAREGTIIAPAPWDDAERTVGFRWLDQYPMVVLAGYDDERVFRQFRPLRARSIGIAIAATIIILLLGGVWIDQRLRSAVSRLALQLTLDHMSQGLAMIDDEGRLPVINRRAVALLGLPEALLAPGRQPGKGEAACFGMLSAESMNPGVVHRDGRIIEIVHQPIVGGGVVRTFTDITERRIAEARIRHMAHHDAMTGLANRSLLTERIAALARAPGVEKFGLVWLGLDGFKAVNDALGHDAGDRLLLEVSRRFRNLDHGGDLLARTGDDEFAVLCASEDQPGGAEALAAEIVRSLLEPIDIDGTQFRLSASLGYALYPEDGLTAPTLLKHAVAAMNQAKQRGRGGHVVRFNPDMDRALRERGQIEQDLRRALRDHELEVWFQPRFETKPMRISGFEALARWRHPDRGFIPPSDFIPVAEQCGLIAELGTFVLNDACAFAASLPGGRIAVNVSPGQFLSDNLADLIGGILADHGLPPERLELEVTEGILISDEAQALATLRTLHDRHLHLALDDFGTGYASLSYLRRFPFDRIKIDQSFVQAQEHDATTRAIVESLLTMAKRLRLQVTAEGVETERQLNLLLDQGCPEIQGYFLGRPMPAVEAREFHAAHGGAVRAPRRSAA